MSIPGSVLAAGWIPFVVVIVLTLLFSGLYIRYFMSKYDSELSTTLTAIICLAVALMTSILVPVDIFLVSYMKASNGTFKPWANDSQTRTDLEESITYAYYGLYAIVTFCLFFLLPFMYFFFEEKDDTEETPLKSRLCSAFKFTIIFVIIMAVLLLIGAFAPTKHVPNMNETEWKRIESLFKDLGSNNGEDALSFVISSLSLIGMLALILYTGYGMAALPVGLIKGSRNVKRERMKVQGRREETRARAAAIREKYASGKRMSSRDRKRVSNLEESEHLLDREDAHLEACDKSLVQKCLVVLRPFEVIIGIVFILVALLVFISLLLTNIDKAMHSLGYKLGYALPTRHLPNPVDIVLVFTQKVFPLDYILMDLIIVYFVFCSMSGIRNIGIWFFWLRMYRIRPRRTSPQGLLFMCFILMLIVLAVNIVLYELTPQYSSFGSQHYITDNGTLTVCSTDAPPGECVITRMALLLTRFFYKMWFFGAAYYWGTWVFLLMILLGFVITTVKKSRSAIDGAVDKDDFDESDDEDMIRA
ncbi:probable lysosomal cobalamin transporter [Liolophura sinensis]|uniref:probable lysosomal cobalamin transporter n=1 Tax=Liolophura sinensis TaxID=3198878 RepID=UPI00315934DB